MIDLEACRTRTTDISSEQEIYLTDSTIIDVNQLVSEISELISLPEVYLKIRELMEDQSACLDDFTAVVNTDPGITASVLKIVNSAFYGYPGQIEVISRAIQLIGIGQLHDLVLSVSAVTALNVSNDIESLSRFWQRNIYCGVLSSLLAKKLRLKNPESLFVVGLLHEIGRLILFLKYPNESKQTIIQAQEQNRSLTEIEKKMFGTDYGQIGRALLREWNLPLKFQFIVGCHTEPDTATEFYLETTIVHIAHQAAANKFPGQNGFHCSIEPDTLAIISTNIDEMEKFYSEADVISQEMKQLILGR
jgi:HD-like signal output (HDOD) protein